MTGSRHWTRCYENSSKSLVLDIFQIFLPFTRTVFNSNRQLQKQLWKCKTKHMNVTYSRTEGIVSTKILIPGYKIHLKAFWGIFILATISNYDSRRNLDLPLLKGSRKLKSRDLVSCTLQRIKIQLQNKCQSNTITSWHIRSFISVCNWN